MKKFVMGIIIGALAMLGVSAYADDAINATKALIGQQVQGTFPIFVGNSKLKTDVITVNNKSYMPVRDIAELFNSNVSFIDSTVIIEPKAGTINTVKLNSLGVTPDDMSQADKDKLAKWQTERDLNQKQDDDLKAKLKAEEDKVNKIKQMFVSGYIPGAPVPAINFEGTMYVPLPAASDKYGIRLSNFDQETKTLTFEKSDVKVILDGDIESSNPRDGFLYTGNMFVKESILMQIQEQQ